MIEEVALMLTSMTHHNENNQYLPTSAPQKKTQQPAKPEPIQYTFEFLPGSMGLELEPVIISSERQIGCRVKDYYFGLTHSGSSPESVKASINVGDVIHMVSGKNVLSEKFLVIMDMLRELRGETRAVVFKRLSGQASTTDMQVTPKTCRSRQPLASRDANVSVQPRSKGSTTKEAGGGPAVSPKLKFMLSPPASMAHIKSSRNPANGASRDAEDNPFVTREMDNEQISTPVAANKGGDRKKKPNDNRKTSVEKNSKTTTAVSSKFNGSTISVQTPIQTRLSLSPVADTYTSPSICRKVVYTPKSKHSASAMRHRALAREDDDDKHDDEDYDDVDIGDADQSMGRLSLDVSPSLARELAAYSSKRSSFVPTVPPVVSDAVSNLLVQMSSAIGSGIVTAGQTVTHHAANTAFAVGDIVSNKAEKLVEKAVKKLPAYSKEAMHELLTKEGALLNELSKTYFALRTAEEKNIEMQEVVDAGIVREGMLNEQLQRSEKELAELKVLVDKLRQEDAKKSADMGFLIDESSAEVEEWRRIAEDHQTRCARLLEQGQANEASMEALREELQQEREAHSAEQLAWEADVTKMKEEMRVTSDDMKDALDRAIAQVDDAERLRDSSVAELEVMKDLLSADKAKAEADLSRCKGNLAAHQATMRESLAEKDLAFENLRKDNAALNQEIAELKRLLSVSESGRAECDDQIKSYEHEVSQLKENLSVMYDAKVAVENEVASLTTLVAEQANALADEGVATSSRVAELESALHAAHTHTEEIEQELHDVKASSAQRNTEFAAILEEKAAEHAAALRKKSEAVEVLQNELNRMSKELKDSVKSYTVAKSELLTVRTDLASYQMREEDMKGVLLDRSNELDRISAQYESTMEQTAALTAELEDLQATVRLHEDNSASLHESLVSSQNEVADTNQRLALANAQISTLTAEVSRFGVILREHEEQGTAVNQSLVSLQLELQEKEIQLNGLEESNASLVADLNAARDLAAKQGTAFCQQVEEKTTESERLKGLIECLGQKMKCLITHSREDLGDVRKQLTDVREFQDTLTGTSAQVSTICKRLQLSAQDDKLRVGGVLENLQKDKDSAMKRAEAAEQNTVDAEKRYIEALETVAKRERHVSELQESLSRAEDALDKRNATETLLVNTRAELLEVQNQHDSVATEAEGLRHDLQEKLAALEALKTELSEKHATQASKMADLQAELSQMEATKNDAVARLSEALSALDGNANAEKELASEAAKKELEARDVCVAKLTEEINDLHRNTDALQGALKDREALVSSVTDKCSAAQNELTALRKEYTEACKSHAATLETLSAKVSDRSAADALARVQKELCILRQQMLKLEEDANASSKRAGTAERALTAEAAAHVEKLSALQSRHEENLRVQDLTRKQEVERLHSKVNEAATARDSLKDRIGQIEGTLNVTLAARDTARSECAQLASKVETLQLESDAQAAEWATAKTSLEDSVSEYSYMLTEMRKKNGDLSSQLSDTQRAQDEALSEKDLAISTLSAELADGKQAVQSAQEACDAALLKSKTIETQLIEVTSKLHATTAYNESLQISYATLEKESKAELESLQQKLQEVSVNSSRLYAEKQSDFDAANSSLSHLKAQFASLQSEYEASKEEAEKAHGTYALMADLEKEVTALKTSLDAARESYSGEIDEANGKLMTLQAKHKKELQSVNEELKASRAQTGTVQNELANHLQRVNHERYALEKECSETVAEYKNQVDELEAQLQTERNIAAERYAHFDALRAAHIDEVNALTADLDKLNDSLAVLRNGHNAELEAMKAAHAESCLKDRAHLMALQAQKETLSAENAKLDDDLKSALSVADKHKMELVMVSQQLESLEGVNKTLSGHEDRHTGLQHTLTKVTDEYSKAVERNRSLTEDMQELLASKLRAEESLAVLKRREADILATLEAQTRALDDASLREQEHIASRLRFEKGIQHQQKLYDDLQQNASRSEKLASQRIKTLEAELNDLHSSEEEARKDVNALTNQLNQLLEHALSPTKGCNPSLQNAITPEKSSDAAAPARQNLLSLADPTASVVSNTCVGADPEASVATCVQLFFTELTDELTCLSDRQNMSYNTERMAKLAEIILRLKIQDRELISLRRENLHLAPLKTSCNVLRAVVKLTLKVWRRSRSLRGVEASMQPEQVDESGDLSAGHLCSVPEKSPDNRKSDMSSCRSNAHTPDRPNTHVASSSGENRDLDTSDMDFWAVSSASESEAEASFDRSAIHGDDASMRTGKRTGKPQRSMYNHAPRECVSDSAAIASLTQDVTGDAECTVPHTVPEAGRIASACCEDSQETHAHVHTINTRFASTRISKRITRLSRQREGAKNNCQPYVRRVGVIEDSLSASSVPSKRSAVSGRRVVDSDNITSTPEKDNDADDDMDSPSYSCRQLDIYS